MTSASFLGGFAILILAAVVVIGLMTSSRRSGKDREDPYQSMRNNRNQDRDKFTKRTVAYKR